MLFILVIVIGLVAWALHLMQEAIQRREFSLMLAGFLVSTAAVGMMAVYFLMSHYLGYMSEMTERAYVMEEWEIPVVLSVDSEAWQVPEDEDSPMGDQASAWITANLN